MFGFIGIMLLNNERIGLIFHLAAFEFFLFSFSVAFTKYFNKIQVKEAKDYFSSQSKV